MRFDQPDYEEREGEGYGQDDDEMIDDDKMIEIAENVLVWIAESLIKSGKSLRQIFQQYLITEVIEDTKIELLSPLNFLDGLKSLPDNHFSELEIACLMNVLAKPQLDNAILFEEIQQIMANFGITES